MAEETVVAKKNPWPLRIVLFVILALMIFALFRDRSANEQYLAAWERIDKLQEEKNAKPGELTTGPEAVREAMQGRASVSGTPEPVDHYFREIYQWRRGLLVNRYFIYVLYQKTKDGPRLYAAFQGREPEADELPSKPLQGDDLKVPTVTEPSGESGEGPPPDLGSGEEAEPAATEPSGEETEADVPPDPGPDAAD